jgi:transposase InsO family protein
MQKQGFRAKINKRFKVTTKANPRAKTAPNLLEHKRWVSDITYVATSRGWLYVVSILDLFLRHIVGFAMSGGRATDLILSALGPSSNT